MRPATIGDLADTTLPLKAMIKISIHEPGGRTTDKTVDIPVRTRDVTDRHPCRSSRTARSPRTRAPVSKSIAVNADGKRIALSGLTYSWVTRRHDLSVVSRTMASWKYQSDDARPADHRRHRCRHRHRRRRRSWRRRCPGAPIASRSPIRNRARRVVLSLLFRLGGERGGRPSRPHSGRRRQADLSRRRNRARQDQADVPTARRWSSSRATACSPRS